MVAVWRIQGKVRYLQCSSSDQPVTICVTLKIHVLIFSLGDLSTSGVTSLSQKIFFKISSRKCVSEHSEQLWLAPRKLVLNRFDLIHFQAPSSCHLSHLFGKHSCSGEASVTVAVNYFTCKALGTVWEGRG